jgi:hypothetical protein
MKVKRIVVDELPKNCASCFYCGTDYSERPVCFALEKEKDIGYVVLGDRYPETRPSWCPLQVEEECVWVREKTDRGYAAFYIPKDHEQHIDCYTQDAGTYDYCPTCGKTIKYVEE